jgi:hypothetical protein
MMFKISDNGSRQSQTLILTDAVSGKELSHEKNCEHGKKIEPRVGMNYCRVIPGEVKCCLPAHYCSNTPGWDAPSRRQQEPKPAILE